jgi:hypothetical protein
VKVTGKEPTYIHNLNRLANLAQIVICTQEEEFLVEMTGWNLSGRYSDRIPMAPQEEQVHLLLNETERIVRWLIQKL